jgi:adenylosuccinate lyase
LRQLNNVWLDLACDSWLYISFGCFRQKTVPGEVGSSTMPHKVNPIHFENAEGNLQTANALLSFLSGKLPISRLQRDLSDKTVKRNLGLAIGHGLVAVQGLCEGLGRLVPDDETLCREVLAHPEVLAEAVQLLLRTRGDEQAFQEVQEQVRGAPGAWQSLLSTLPNDIRDRVATWTPDQYVGLAKELTLHEIERIEHEISDAESPRTADR